LQRGKAPELTQEQLIKMAADAAEGMAYLSTMKIVHRDLAGRNCLVHQDYRVCIGDFGISRDVYSREYYKMSGAAALPIRYARAPPGLQVPGR
jgi:serine/threonine protein kinase